MPQLVKMEKIECQFYTTERCIKTIKSCVCGKIHRFYYKVGEFDSSNFTSPFSLFRFCTNKPIELVIIKPNKDNKTKIDWNDTDAAKEYKKLKKREYDLKHKQQTPPNTPIIPTLIQLDLTPTQTKKVVKITKKNI